MDLNFNASASLELKASFKKSGTTYPSTHRQYFQLNAMKAGKKKSVKKEAPTLTKAQRSDYRLGKSLKDGRVPQDKLQIIQQWVECRDPEKLDVDRLEALVEKLDRGARLTKADIEFFSTAAPVLSDSLLSPQPQLAPDLSPVEHYINGAEKYCWNQICAKYLTNHGSVTANGLIGFVGMLYGLERKPYGENRNSSYEGSPNEWNYGQQRQRERELGATHEKRPQNPGNQEQQRRRGRELEATHEKRLQNLAN
ncbi:hypothetical protein R3P38DRAFT_2795045 [Favolaschia claudopus]|uniref:Uncharacterized protein n=1 Tax=Favolaschia claudopus TaxID=2862362 RepID=A0AAW0A7A6_9AGAR